MERDTFDQFTRVFGVAGSRRAALGLLVTGALLGSAATGDGADAKRRHRRGRARSQDRALRVEQVPSICLVTGRTGCSKPQGNCADKQIEPGADLRNCNFITESGGVFETNFRNANLTGACFLAAELFNRPSFRGANVERVCFFEADLSFSDFRNANVRGATFCDAILTGVDFRGSNVTAAQLACAAVVDCSTILPNGEPAVLCAAGETCCLGICTDLDTDPDNCGACENVCTPPQTCEQGACGVG